MWTRYWPVYEQLEREFCDLSFFINLEDAHLNVFSIKLAELLLRIGQECENAGKTLATQLRLSPASGPIERLHFPQLGDLLCSAVPLNTKVSAVPLNTKVVEVIWVYQLLTVKSFTPFKTWSTAGSTNPVWYQGYNGLKHDRNANFQRANFGNVLEALAGLFILNLWLRKDNIEEDSEWLVLTRKRIMSYSKLFDPSGFLQLANGGGVNRRLEFI